MELIKIQPITSMTSDGWNAFCQRSDEAWFWHTTHYLDFVMSLRPEHRAENLSFCLTKGTELIGLCPLILETRMICGKEVKEFSFDSGPGPSPALGNGYTHGDRLKFQTAILDGIDEIADSTGVVRASFRESNLTKPCWENRYWLDLLMSRKGYLDVSLNTQILDLDSTEEQLLRQMRKGHRAAIKQSTRSIDTEVFDQYTITPEIFELYREMHFKAAGRITRPLVTFEAMYDWVKSGLAVLAGARLGDEWMGFIHTNLYKAGAYYGSAANDPIYRNFPVSHAIQWSLIKWLKGMGIKNYELGTQRYRALAHDFPSKKDMDISHFKRGFGGDPHLFTRKEKYYSVEFYKLICTERMTNYAVSLAELGCT